MIIGVAIQGAKQYAFSSDPDIDALEHLAQMAEQGLNAFGFRIDTGVILLVGESVRTVILGAGEKEN